MTGMLWRVRRGEIVEVLRFGELNRRTVREIECRRLVLRVEMGTSCEQKPRQLTSTSNEKKNRVKNFRYTAQQRCMQIEIRAPQIS
jgi:hypothetical protein